MCVKNLMMVASFIVFHSEILNIRQLQHQVKYKESTMTGLHLHMPLTKDIYYNFLWHPSNSGLNDLRLYWWWLKLRSCYWSHCYLSYHGLRVQGIREKNIKSFFEGPHPATTQRKKPAHLGRAGLDCLDIWQKGVASMEVSWAISFHEPMGQLTWEPEYQQMVAEVLSIYLYIYIYPKWYQP